GFVLLLLSRAPLAFALITAPYAMLMALRWFGRFYGYANGRNGHALVSDMVYAGVLVGSLVGLLLTRRLTLITGGEALLAASALSFVALGSRYLKRQFVAIGKGSLLAYRPIWMDLTRWSL